ncbi:Hypothetical_protein [Hexamita inflata]|uniref:Hypothetical_protein n=1 Tax=Hexamita inflata TaxID=28002 RepID=A0AA86R505_9EUKA|nr:Hypothetical protein HINF_LOCUS56608 [Hexamita inflata]
MNLMLQEQIDSLQQQLSEAYDLIDKLQTQNNHLTNNQQQLATTMTRSTLSKSQILDQRDTEIQQLRQQLQLKSLSCDELSDQNASLKDQLQQSEQQSEYYKSEFLKLQEHSLQQQNQFKQTIQQQQTQIAHAQAELSSSVQKLKLFELESSELKNINTQLENELTVFKVAKSDNSAQTSFKLFTDSDLDIINTKFEAELADLTLQLNNQSSLNSVNSQKYEFYKNKFLQIESANNDLTVQLNELNDVLQMDGNAAKKALVQCQIELAELNALRTQFVVNLK